MLTDEHVREIQGEELLVVAVVAVVVELVVLIVVVVLVAVLVVVVLVVVALNERKDLFLAFFSSFDVFSYLDQLVSRPDSWLLYYCTRILRSK